uniref:Pectinesterase n=1 Tax=Cunninghamia lanceolata TaxID=28977 RepID=A0A6G9W363_CUNLA|nr:pectin methylesterase 10 [Cunninghamia lanceolata]
MGEKKIVAVVVTAALVLSIILVAVSAGIVIARKKASGNGGGWNSGSRVINLACSKTLYPALCVSTLVSYPGVKKASRTDFAHMTVNVTMGGVQQAYSMALNVDTVGMSSTERFALEDCLELLEDSMDHLKASMDKMAAIKVKPRKHQIADVQTWLSAALTNQETCLEGFERSSSNVKAQIEERSKKLSQLVSNSLALLKVSFPESGPDTNEFRIPSPPGRRRLLQDHEEFYEQYGFHDHDDEFPAWLSAGDRNLLQAPNAAVAGANVVVAKDGSGQYMSIVDAVNDAPSKSNQRYIIYVKAGMYSENVTVSRKKTNLMFVGDGMGKTIIVAGRNVREGFTTFRSATFAASGKGFIARDITFINNAGPENHQAVALRVGADYSAIYRCNFIGYQDTLYVHSLRQFYRECDIYGTVDFIFGNAAVVIQNSNIFPRRPMANQKNTITAQSRKDPNQNTGISIHNCKVAAAKELIPVKSQFPTYLGRPWKMYSRTVYMQTFLDDLIDPAGWLEWSGNFALKTLYYGEYRNTGPGANLAGRVKWSGYRVITTADEANQFTVASLISGSTWLPSTGISFIGGLLAS